ncbi:MAG: MFS transporter [Planctomycetes bacterium]|nr:MFS transporter [Planctomycetota bacterium]
MASKQRTAHGRGTVLAWALYDWGNSAFATSVLVGFFPLIFNQYWSTDASGASTTTRLMTANGVASLVLALCAPLLGATADSGGWRKRSLMTFAACGAAATAGLFFVPQGAWIVAVVVFGAASVGFAAANVFYDAMLIDVAREERFDRVSAFGYALGYIGGGVLLAVNMAMVLKPEWFGLPDAETAARAVFLTVAGWWAIFTLPLVFGVREQAPERPRSLPAAVSHGLSQLMRTFRRIRQLRPVVLFLAAYWLYIDGVNTVMKVAVDFGYKLGFGQQDLLTALLVVQFVSFPAALGFGRLGERMGPKRALMIGLSVYVGVTLWAAFLDALWEFYVLACAVGLVQGGVFSLSRSYYARLIPREEAAEFYGFYNMVGKFAAVLGPFLVAGAAALTGSTRTAVVAILPLFLIGGALLAAGPTKAPRKADGGANS